MKLDNLIMIGVFIALLSVSFMAVAVGKQIWQNGVTCSHVLVR